MKYQVGVQYLSDIVTRLSCAALPMGDAGMSSRRAEDFPDRNVAGNAARAFTTLLTEILEPLEQLANCDDAALLGRLQDLAPRQMALVRRGERLAAHLLAYSGEQQLNPIRLELLPFLANLTHTLRGVVDKSIDVTAEVGHDCPACEVDAEALEEALLHLTRNALDAMPNGGQLRFSAQADLLPDSRPGNPTVALSVSDSGARMTPQYVRRAAQPVVTAKAHDPLVGMGLAAADGFARQSGGCLTLESVGGGMRATLHLPQVGSVKTTHAGETQASSVALPIGEARLRGILDSANDAIVSVDDSQMVVMANPAAAQMFRCPIDAVIGAPLEQFIPKRFRDGHRRYMEAFGEGEGTLRTMGRRTVVMGLRSDGEEFPADASISHLSADGRRLYTVILRDVTESLRADTALRKSEALLRRLLALLPEAVIVSSGSRISFVNEAARRLLGADESALLGRLFLEILHPDSAELAKSRFLALHDGISTVPLVEEKILRSDGTIRIVQTMATSFEDHGETSILSAMRDVTELRQARADLTVSRDMEEQLQRLARVDPLTAIANRRSFDEHLEEALARSRRTHQPAALLLLDVDDFKQINDTHGHGIGDQVLKEFATRLKDCARTTDTVARLGGDEFAFILEGLHGVEDAQVVARKLRSELEPAFVFGELAPLSVTASIGVAVFTGDDADAAALVARADEALYQAKHAGRNTFAVSGWHSDEGERTTI